MGYSCLLEWKGDYLQLFFMNLWVVVSLRDCSWLVWETVLCCVWLSDALSKWEFYAFTHIYASLKCCWKFREFAKHSFQNFLATFGSPCFILALSCWRNYFIWNHFLFYLFCLKQIEFFCYELHMFGAWDRFINKFMTIKMEVYSMWIARGFCH